MARYVKKRPLRRPEHPGAILKRLWLDELGYTQSSFADELVAHTCFKIKKNTMQTKLSELINGKRAMSADFAVLISHILKTSPKMWMGLQSNLDIWEAEHREKVA
jgi:addiction module HigA family antidote